MMAALGSAHEAASLRGQREAEGAAVLGMDGPADEPLGVEPVHDAGEVARGDEKPARELDEREAVRFAVELVQDVELREGAVHPDGAPQLALDERVGVEQPQPRADRQVAVGDPPHSGRQANPSISIRQPSAAS